MWFGEAKPACSWLGYLGYFSCNCLYLISYQQNINFTNVKETAKRHIHSLNISLQYQVFLLNLPPFSFVHIVWYGLALFLPLDGVKGHHSIFIQAKSWIRNRRFFWNVVIGDIFYFEIAQSSKYICRVSPLYQQNSIY